MSHTFPVLLSNISTSSQTSWNYCAAVPKKYSDSNYYGIVTVDNNPSRTFPAAVIDGELFVKATMSGQEGTYQNLGYNETLNFILTEPLRCTFSPVATAAAAGITPFQKSDWVPVDILELFPQFRINNASVTSTWYNSSSFTPVVWDGAGTEPVSYIRLESSNIIRKRYFLKTKIIEGQSGFSRPIHIWGWIDVFSDQDVVPYSFNFSYNNVTNNANTTAREFAVGGNYNYFDLYQQFGKMEMHVNKKCHVDFYKRKGLRKPYCSDAYEKFIVTLTNPKRWTRSRVFECYGAFLCAPSQFNTTKYSPDPNINIRLETIVARTVGPICAFIDGWDGENLAFKTTGPTPGLQASYPFPIRNLESWASKVAQDELGDCGREMYGWLVNWPYNDNADDNELNRNYNENYWFTRKLTAYPEAGSSGDVTDFGASKNHGLMVFKKPWMIWDYRFQSQLWKMRKLSHFESNGSIASYVNHPNACFVDLGPYYKAGVYGGPAGNTRILDSMGWYVGESYPNEEQAPFIIDGSYIKDNSEIQYVQWTYEDDEHRSDNLLFGTLLVTKDPSVKNCVDHFFNDQMMNIDYPARSNNQYYGYVLNPDAPRGQGRLLMSMCHMISLGYTQLIPRVERLVKFIYDRSSYRLPSSDYNGVESDATVKVISYNGYKKGWFYGDNPSNAEDNSICAPCYEQPTGWPTCPNCVNVNNVPGVSGVIPGWVTWEHSIAVMGLWAAWLTPELSSVYDGKRIRDMAKEVALVVSRTLVREGFYTILPGLTISIYAQRRNLIRKGISWKDVQNIPGGNPFERYGPLRNESTLKNKYIEYDGSYTYLLMPAIRLFLLNTDLGDPDYAKALEIANNNPTVFDSNSSQFSPQSFSWYAINPESLYALP
jgi:hypothetical protein